MNLETGEIHQTNTLLQWKELKDRVMNLEELANLPNPDCKDCSGKGWIGRSKITGLYIVCDCCKLKLTEKREGDSK